MGWPFKKEAPLKVAETRLKKRTQAGPKNASYGIFSNVEIMCVFLYGKLRVAGWAQRQIHRHIFPESQNVGEKVC